MVPVLSLYFLLLFICIGTHGQSLINMHQSQLDPLDLEVRKEVLILLSDNLTAIVDGQKVAINQCEIAINDTIDQCNACRQNLCVPKPPLDQQILLTLNYGTNAVGLYTGKIVNEAGNWFSQKGDWFGNRAGDFASSLSNTANSVGGTLEGAGLAALNAMVSGFKSLGSDLKVVQVKLEEGLNKGLVGFISLGSNLKNLDNFIGSSLTGLGSSLGNFFGNIGNDIGGWFSGLGRKRRFALHRNRRCVNSCPVCDKLNTETQTTEQIMENVCGTAFTQSQSKALAAVAFIEVTFNKTRDEAILTKVEYNVQTADWSTGIPIIVESFYETTKTGRVQYGPSALLYLTDNTKSGKGIGKNYFERIWAAAGHNQ